MKRGDVLVIAVVLLLGIVCLVWPTFAGQDKREAVVSLGGQEIIRMELTEQTQQTIPVKLPNGVANIEILKGQVRLEEMKQVICPNGICSHTGWISQGGESIVCVPNHLSIIIRAESGVDAMAR